MVLGLEEGIDLYDLMDFEASRDSSFVLVGSPTT